MFGFVSDHGIVCPRWKTWWIDSVLCFLPYNNACLPQILYEVLGGTNGGGNGGGDAGEVHVGARMIRVRRQTLGENVLVPAFSGKAETYGRKAGLGKGNRHTEGVAEGGVRQRRVCRCA